MSGTKKVNQDMILSCAFEISKKEGISNVNARRIGKELDCSLKPVYYYFKTMDCLRQCIIDKAYKLFLNYIENSRKEYDSFLAVGMGYIKFASDEKELFKLLFMRDTKYQSNDMINQIQNNDFDISQLQQLYGLTEKQVKELYFQTWIGTHGIASMIATNYMIFTDDYIRYLLDNLFMGLVHQLKKEL